MMEAKDMRQTELAYYAGLFDGEGCIHIRKTKTKRQQITYGLVCKISMCNFFVLEQLQQSFGGSLHKEREHKYSNRYNKLWTWTLSCIMAKAFLIAVYPFLRLKKSEAELAIQFQETKVSGARKGQWGNIPKMEKELAIEEAEYILMRNLKKGAVQCQLGKIQ